MWYNIAQEKRREKASVDDALRSANILIFPNLDAANIGYKITEKLAGATAIGPIFQGAKKPINGLSRGCGVDDIINTVAVTAALS